MTQGFFPLTLASPKPAIPLLPQCGACQLYLGCESPKMPVAGKGRKGILVIGEAPGEREDDTGKPFVGKTGKYLQQTLAKFDVDLFRDCWVTNSAICRPKDNILPAQAITHCRPNVVNAIKELKPKTILLWEPGPYNPCWVGSGSPTPVPWPAGSVGRFLTRN